MDRTVLFLFDLDATLVRTGGVGMEAMTQAFEECFGWPDALANISPAGRTDTSIAHELSNHFQGRDMTDGEMAQVFPRYLVLLEEKLAQTDRYRVMPGIIPFLEKARIRPDYFLALGTGNLEKGARIKLAPADLNRFFPVGGFGSDAVIRKDLLEIAVQRAEAHLGRAVLPERVVVIGDTHHDIEAGQAMGARTIAVATGPFDVAYLTGFGPDLVLPDFTHTEALDRFLEKF